MSLIKLTLPLPPSSNKYWRHVAMPNGRSATLISKEARIYKRQVALLVNSSVLIQSNIAITVRIFRAQRSGDLDNKLKVLFDSLQGVIYANDSQIVEIHAFRYEDKLEPRVEVEIRNLGLC